VVGKVQGGSRGPVELGAWGAAPAAAVKIEKQEKGARLSQA